MSAAVIVKNELPAEIVALKDETLAEVQALTAEANDMVLAIKDADTYAAGNDLFRRIEAFNKQVTEQRMEITRPIDALKAAIMEAARRATIPLSDANKALGQRLWDMKKELERQRQEAERKARAEAEARAKAERERLEAERQAIIRKQQEERAAQEAAAKEQADLFGTEAEPLPPAPEPPPAAVVVPVVDAVAVPAPLPKSAVRGKTDHVLVILDAAKIPREIAGKVLLVPDEKAIKALMKLGVEVPGCRLDEVCGFASKGGRS